MNSLKKFNLSVNLKTRELMKIMLYKLYACNKIMHRKSFILNVKY